jgi:hypothetical protein
MKFWANLASAVIGAALVGIGMGLWRHQEDLLVACVMLLAVSAVVRGCLYSDSEE